MLIPSGMTAPVAVAWGERNKINSTWQRSHDYWLLLHVEAGTKPFALLIARQINAVQRRPEKPRLR